MKCLQKLLIVGSVLMTGALVQADETKPKKHLVDMADGMNQQEFYATKNPDAIFSSDGSAPWTKSDAVNAWEQTDGKTSKVVKEDLDKIDRPSSSPVLENGKEVEAGTPINIRVRYTLDAEHSKALFSPVSAQNEMYRQMGSHCGNGFQKMNEWSEPIDGADYYLFYQFRCMASSDK